MPDWSMSILLNTTGVGASITIPEVPFPVFGGVAPVTLLVNEPMDPISADGAFTQVTEGSTWQAFGLPDGIAIEPATGRITGTPTALTPERVVVLRVITPAGVLAENTFRIRVTDAAGSTGSDFTGDFDLDFD